MNYCYRHRPDLTCRRQMDEPSMEQLQNELSSLQPSDQQSIAHFWSIFSAAPAKHRNLMLRGILTQCCFPQLSFLSAKVRELIKIDFLSTLPTELGLKILGYLDTTSLCKAAQVSRRWRNLADDNMVWQRMCEQHIDRKCTKCGWGLPLLERSRLLNEKRQLQLREANGHPPKRPLEDPLNDSPATKRLCPPLPWKHVYRERFKVGWAWKSGHFRTLTLSGHANGVMCLQFLGHTLMTGSYDSTIKIWNARTGSLTRTLNGHTSGIRCLQFDETKLMTGSLDSTLKLWDWNTGTCLRTFPAHSAGIASLHYTDRYVATGSMDRTIRVWDSLKKTTFLLRGHDDCVNSVRIDEPSRTLFSASEDFSMRLWDLEGGGMLRIFNGHVGPVTSLIVMPEGFEPAALTGEGESDSGSGSTNTTTAIHQYWKDESRPPPPRYIFSGALDATVRLWDVHYPHPPSPSAPVVDERRASLPPSNGPCCRTLFGHVEGIWALAADRLRLVSAGEDQLVKIWDPRSGVCERTFTGHQGPVSCVALADWAVAMGSSVEGGVTVLYFGE
ncbi:WD40 repeat-like protein [Piedraia hortae CBS 480.64]|uniref:WD40 repeat-like protein n=1 Tax=Piedraia hortae CBS 480.64 TaxID=1314780 RepID=A0A6A7BSG3_9PEZI|nr:WD40 repeat-like protein [Piedraia hortae CBS 480.64]